MQLRVLGRILLGGLFGTAHANTTACEDKTVVVEYQPIASVCSGVTSMTTEVHTTTECGRTSVMKGTTWTVSARTTATSSTGSLNTGIVPMSPTSASSQSCPTPTCNPGMEMAHYDNPFAGDTSATFKSLKLDYFKSAKPLSTKIAHGIYVKNDDKNNPIARAAVMYRGFLFTCQSGTYKFSSPYTDDVTFMWFGEKAYSGWNRENVDIAQFYYGDNTKKTISRDLTAGIYYPIRVFWGNTGGPAYLQLNITGPDGKQLSSSEPGEFNWLVPEACDGSYKPFPPFGSGSKSTSSGPTTTVTVQTRTSSVLVPTGSAEAQKCDTGKKICGNKCIPSDEICCADASKECFVRVGVSPCFPLRRLSRFYLGKEKHVATATDCIRLCKSKPGCQSVSYRESNGNCWFKSQPVSVCRGRPNNRGAYTNSDVCCVN